MIMSMVPMPYPNLTISPASLRIIVSIIFSMISRDSGDPISSPGSLKTMRKVFTPDRSPIVLLDSGGLLSVHAVRDIRIERMSIPLLFLMLTPDLMLTWVELNQLLGLLID